MSSITANGSMEDADAPVVIGVLALQGAFREHIAHLNRLPGVSSVEVRNKEQLANLDGLIIPGGESTTMANIAQRWGLIPELKNFAEQGRPMWGTCAGLIFLADRATGQKEGGQALLGGLDCKVHRNFFGAQINSFETELPVPQALKAFESGPQGFRAMFIRAPAILEAGPSVEVLSEYRLTPSEQAVSNGLEKVSVAVRSKNLLATAFHPELTEDCRWHKAFVDMVREGLSRDGKEGLPQGSGSLGTGSLSDRGSGKLPADLPVYKADDKL
ncbi:Pyridoxal 5'-phosphate synthase subunit PdxT [Coccomyxa sp. Obi]|nr:Pyridoxal 5'-phosphate synthase subunit PdxT [Coccomyxa sp. Obi]